MQGQTSWLKIGDGTIDVANIIAQIQHKAAQQGEQNERPELLGRTPEQIAQELHHTMLGSPDSDQDGVLTIRQSDCDIIPNNYVIDWRIPILGPIHAVVRRLINDEIRRFLFPPLQKQSRINHQLLQAVNALIEENQHLRDEVNALKLHRNERKDQ